MVGFSLLSPSSKTEGVGLAGTTILMFTPGRAKVAHRPLDDSQIYPMFRLVVLSLLPGDEDVRKEVAIQVIANQTVVQSEVLCTDKR